MSRDHSTLPSEAPVPARILRLPELLRDIAKATDYETAIKIARTMGGRRAYIARNPTPRSWLVRLVGMDTARKIGTALHVATGFELEIPLFLNTADERKRSVESLTLQGISKMKIAGLLGLHHRTIQKYRAGLRAEGRIPPIAIGGPIHDLKPGTTRGKSGKGGKHA